MASVVVKTIWQSKEIHEAGDPPAGVESRSQLVPEAPGGVISPAKGIAKKKKAVSFHGVEPRMSHEPMHWCLNLKRSSACTNVSLLNLAAMEPTDSSGTDSTTEDSGQLALPGPPASPTPPWAPDDPDITEILSGVNSGLVRAKDSITSLKEKTTRVNQHVQTLQVHSPVGEPVGQRGKAPITLAAEANPSPLLQSECSVLSENLERRRQEAEELEGYCSQLKENCRKVTRSVEDAEIKTNVLKQNSALLEEKLRYLQQQLQDETPRRQEAELQELEQKLEAGLSRHGLGPPSLPQGGSGPPGSPEDPPRSRSLASLGGWGMGPRAGEGPLASEQELQKVTAGLEELRREVSSLTARWHQEEGAVQEALRLLGGLGGRLDGFLGQWERAQREQAQTARGLQELRSRADELCTMVERSAVSVASLRSELEGLGPVKPILEELGRQFQSSRRGSDLSMSLDRSPQGSCARCASQGQQLSTESLQQLLERALTPLVDEVKQRGLAPACPSCQRLHKKILLRLRSSPQELERQALAKHVRAEALSSTLRLAQDEALRAKNLLLTDKMKPERLRAWEEGEILGTGPESPPPSIPARWHLAPSAPALRSLYREKVAALDYLHLKMCSLHDQLSNLPLEGSTGTMGGGSGGGTPPKRGGATPEQ
ncbi:LOW QUALITY PROTEIN: Testis-specific serine kinase substrate [Galemys pyrenaicus]|uniref:Testis-specific serine kinase substrate n=1 Tax=Galemys pyrenaicus TaxID=202257 RepID=A0A8J6AL63_GALPY|nr:LOW QUALITY PROTEIN: Testis-specific serine kinase substrate [Galemys pyrenaicus]